MIQKVCEKLTKTQTKQKKTRGSGARSGTLPQGPGNTIRSKIEDKLTEEICKDRENAAHANTPWAPSGPERIEFACGKVPLQAHRDVGCEGQGAWYFLSVLC